MYAMKTYIINLPASVDKRNTIAGECARLGLDVEFIEAVNGNALTEEQIHAQVPDYPACSLTRGEIGCALSHLSIYQKMVDEHIPMAFILEDDANIGADIHKVLDALHSRDDAHVPHVYLLSESYYYIERPSEHLTMQYQLCRALSAYYGYGYVINLNAAADLLRRLRPIRFEADRWTYFQQCGWITLECVVPPVVCTLDVGKAQSSIHEEREQLSPLRKAYYRKLKRKIPFVKKLKRIFWRGYAHIFQKVHRS